MTMCSQSTKVLLHENNRTKTIFISAHKRVCVSVQKRVKWFPIYIVACTYLLGRSLGRQKFLFSLHSSFRNWWLQNSILQLINGEEILLKTPTISRGCDRVVFEQRQRNTFGTHHLAPLSLTVNSSLGC